MNTIKLQFISKLHAMQKFNQSWCKLVSAFAIAVIVLGWSAQNAIAHHPFGGQTPDNFVTAMLSGLSHPVIGLDHFAFVVAIGLVAAGIAKGWLIPLGFIGATVAGTYIHLLGWDLPLPEIAIAASVILFGLLIAYGKQKTVSHFPTRTIALLATLAGIFHGYAYGEAIIGAEMTPLLGYLIGFATIQLAIASIALNLGDFCQQQLSQKPFAAMQFFGFAIATIGIVFFTSAMFG